MSSDQTGASKRMAKQSIAGRSYNMAWHVRLEGFLEIWEGGSLNGTSSRVLNPARGKECKMGQTWENLGRMKRGWVFWMRCGGPDGR